MGPLDFGTIAARHIRNTMAEELYLYTGRDSTKPVTIYGTVNERCNYKCGYCECWRRPEYEQEMTTHEWQRAILSLKEFLGRYLSNFPAGSLI